MDLYMLCVLELTLCLTNGMFYATDHAKDADRNPTGQPPPPKEHFFEGDRKTAHHAANEEGATSQMLETAHLHEAASGGVARPPRAPRGGACRG